LSSRTNALIALTSLACACGTGGAASSMSGSSGAGEVGSADSSAGEAACDDPGLQWHTANKTNYESYPAPDSEECVVYHGCDYLGQFAACDNTMPEAWVASHDIVAVFPLGDLALHRLCLRAGDRSHVVTVIDTCADSDCDGCCSENRGDADALVDVESYTDMRLGIPDGPIEWADLGPGDPSFDGCN
jgi:hypothetical protein